MTRTPRSLHPLTDQHLQRLSDMVILAHDRLTLGPRPDLRTLLSVGCLAQGGAWHRVDASVGIKDLDVWLFYGHTEQGGPAPARRRVTMDFGPSELGAHPDDDPAVFSGRRVDVLCRTSPSPEGTDPRDVVRAWLEKGSGSAHFMRQKPIIQVWPAAGLGDVLWQPSD